MLQEELIHIRRGGFVKNLTKDNFPKYPIIMEAGTYSSTLVFHSIKNNRIKEAEHEILKQLMRIDGKHTLFESYKKDYILLRGLRLNKYKLLKREYGNNHSIFIRKEFYLFFKTKENIVQGIHYLKNKMIAVALYKNMPLDEGRFYSFIDAIGIFIRALFYKNRAEIVLKKVKEKLEENRDELAPWEVVEHPSIKCFTSGEEGDIVSSETVFDKKRKIR